MILLEIVIAEEELRKSRRSLERTINGHTHRIKDKLEKHGAQKSIEALYSAFSAVDIIWKELASSFAPDDSLAAALHIGADFGLSRLEYVTNGVFRRELIDLSEPYPIPVDKILGEYSSELDKSNTDLDRMTGSFLTWVHEGTGHQINDPRLFSLPVKIGSYTLTGKSTSHDSDYTWDNFGGYFAAVNYLQELELIIKNFEYCKQIEQDHLIPKGILLYGPPGTGKTRLARTFCSEAGIPCQTYIASQIGTQFVNESARNLQKKFDIAKISLSNYPVAAIFIDEIDVLCSTRGTNHNEDDKVVAALNANMSGHLAVEGIMVIGATNRIESLDNSLLRPGRFTKKIHVGDPDDEEIRDIFSVYFGGTEVDIDKIIPYRSSWRGAMIEYTRDESKRRKMVRHLKGEIPYGVLQTEDVIPVIQNE